MSHITITVSYKCSAVAEMGDRLAIIDTGRKYGGCAPFGMGAGSPCNTMWPGPRPTFVPSGILIHPAVCHNKQAENCGLCPVLRRGAGSPSNTVAWVEAYLHTKWHLDPSSHLATTYMGRNWGLCPFGGGGPGSPSNTVSFIAKSNSENCISIR